MSLVRVSRPIAVDSDDWEFISTLAGTAVLAPLCSTGSVSAVANPLLL